MNGSTDARSRRASHTDEPTSPSALSPGVPIIFDFSTELYSLDFHILRDELAGGRRAVSLLSLYGFIALVLSQERL